MKIQKIYEKYKVMPQLQMHMLRVAGVANLICNNFNEEIDTRAITNSCLLHDIGNIVKFKLERFPEFLSPQGYEYWEDVQNEFVKRYGNDDYTATYKILTEMGINKKIFDYIQAIEFIKAEENSKNKDFNKKIILYSDARVSPKGITSLQDRVSEVKNRFIKNRKISEDRFNTISDCLIDIEWQIISRSKIKPQDITEQQVNPLLVSLRDFEIQTHR